MNTKKITAIYILSLILLGACIIASLTLGSKSIPLKQTIATLFYNDTSTVEAIIVQQRIPRTIFCLLAGMSLAISGALMQSVTRNPIADPSILGVNMGASLFVVSGIAFFGITTLNEYIILALLGAGLTSIFVYTVASLGIGGITPIQLALAGSATTACLSSLISIVLLPRSDVMNSFRFWQVGSVSGADYESIKAILPFIIVGFLIAISMSKSLNILALGDEVATGLGVNVKKTTLLCSIAGVILCGSITAIAGPIGFVGLIIPHIIRLLLGSNLNNLIPLSAISGAILLTASDVIGRIIGSPSEVEVGIVTAFLGAPILILIARKAKVKQL